MLAITSENDAKKQYIGTLAVCLPGVAVIFYIDGMPLIVISAVILLCIFVAVRGYVAFFRKLNINEEGVMIEVFKHRRFIPWTAFSTIYIKKNSLTCSYKYPYTGAFVASLKPVFKPFGVTMNPVSYTMLHPFSFVFVFFPAEASMSKHPRLRYPMFYPCDQELFMERIAEWGIKYDTIS